MASEKAYDEKKGIRTYNKDSWNEFSNLFNIEFSTKKGGASNNKLYFGDYVWRGHKCEYLWQGDRRKYWKLVSSFDREFENNNGNFFYDPDRNTLLHTRHLNSFAYAVRSRLKEFGLTIREIKEKFDAHHIWALAQHYELKTPLLDWCYSPYVAAYFAFKEKSDNEKNNDKHEQTKDTPRENKSNSNDKDKCRVVWGLNYKQVCDNYTATGISNTGIEYFDPMSSEHPRLINQRGLFTITKPKKSTKEVRTNGNTQESIKGNDIDIEGVIKNNECAGCNNVPWLIKIRITDSKENREEFLRRLNAMNINHMSLFPEIEGAAEFCNIGLEFDEYARFHGQVW